MKTIEQLTNLVRKQNLEIKSNEKILLKTPMKEVQNKINEAAEVIWKKSDCLSCANCCKNISPIIEFEDIHRIAPYLNLSAGDFIKNHLEMDEDGDFVFQTKPCPMLGKDNKCSIYEVRPKACAEYPHLNQINSKKMIKLAFENMKYCGVVYDTIKSVSKK